MKLMKLYGLEREWDDEAYRALIDAAGARGGYCVLVLRKGASPSCLKWIEQRAVELESKDQTMRWPGTIVFDDADAATLLKYRITSELLSALRSSAESPFDWLGPDLPEDLSFLRSDGRPWFISIAHERDAFFKLEDGELESLRDAGLALVEQGRDQAPGEVF